MKRHAYILVLALAGLAACNNGPKFTVKGNVANGEGKTIYFDATTVSGLQVLDSAQLKADGSFLFKAPRPASPEYYRLRLKNQVINLAIDSTETITIQADTTLFATNYEVEGSENNKKIKELVLLQSELQKEVSQVMGTNQPIGLVLDKANALISAYKDKVRREYIYAAPNTTYAYFALFQTLNGYNIFDPLTNKDDVKCFAAVATSLQNAYPEADRTRNLCNLSIKGMKNTRPRRVKELQIPEEKISVADNIDIALKNSNGKVCRLTELKGKVVLLDFTTFDAALSSTHNLALRELYNKFHAQGLEIYQVSFDANEHLWKTQTQNLPWVCVHDPNGIYSQYISTYNIQKLPTVYLLGRDNEIKERGEEITDFEATIQKYI